MNTTSTPVPLFDGVVSAEARDAADAVLRSGQIAGGPKVAEFEAQFGISAGQPHVVSTNDMTSAMALALTLAGVGRGDDVLAMPYSCMSSNAAIAHVGAKPAWVDIDPHTASMSLQDLERAVTPRTRALSLYHVAGYPARIREIANFCRERNIALIEDCNNALGASVGGLPLGQWGDFAIYSFYPNRQVNALEGGALGCKREPDAVRARRLRRFGIDALTFRDSRGEINPASNIPEIGWAASLSQLNAAVGLAHLKTWPERLARVRTIAKRYDAAFAGMQQLSPVVLGDGAEGVYWGYLVLCEQRDALLAALKAGNVQASILHHRNDDYSGFHADPRPLPGTEHFMKKVLALPCGWWLSEDQVDRVIDLLISRIKSFR
jgi:perosamine synthetase